MNEGRLTQHFFISCKHTFPGKHWLTASDIQQYSANNFQDFICNSTRHWALNAVSGAGKCPRVLEYLSHWSIVLASVDRIYTTSSEYLEIEILLKKKDEKMLFLHLLLKCLLIHFISARQFHFLHLLMNVFQVKDTFIFHHMVSLHF